MHFCITLKIHFNEWLFGLLLPPIDFWCQYDIFKQRITADCKPRRHLRRKIPVGQQKNWKPFTWMHWVASMRKWWSGWWVYIKIFYYFSHLRDIWSICYFLIVFLLKNKNYVARNVGQYVSPSILYINEGNWKVILTTRKIILASTPQMFYHQVFWCSKSKLLLIGDRKWQQPSLMANVYLLCL